VGLASEKGGSNLKRLPSTAEGIGGGGSERGKLESYSYSPKVSTPPNQGPTFEEQRASVSILNAQAGIWTDKVQRTVGGTFAFEKSANNRKVTPARVGENERKGKVMSVSRTLTGQYVKEGGRLIPPGPTVPVERRKGKPRGKPDMWAKCLLYLARTEKRSTQDKRLKMTWVEEVLGKKRNLEVERIDPPEIQRWTSGFTSETNARRSATHSMPAGSTCKERRPEDVVS